MITHTVRLLLLSAFVAMGSAAFAQQSRLLVGAGALPGAGAFVSYSSPRLFILTQEASLYADYTPGGETDGRVLASLGVGGSVQLIRLVELIRNDDAGPLGVDVGLRIGPSFYFAFNEQTGEDEARSFRVQFDPFVRGMYRTSGGTVFFSELGATAPGLRAGVALGL
ncbi:MAG: hypothetical protein R3284_08070 [Rubricoccaceae bacterium]|nr:hypothetical protein [Rubricoccaceae bacterium]